MKNVAIVKVSFTREARAAKVTVRYNQHRAGKDGAKITRTLYNWDGAMERSEAYQMIDDAKRGAYFYRLIINPDPLKEDTNRDIYIRQLATETLQGLEERLGTYVQWVGATHDDHTSLRHVHILAILPRKLERADLFALRNLATHAAIEQRRQRDAIIAHEREEEKGREWDHTKERLR